MVIWKPKVKSKYISPNVPPKFTPLSPIKATPTTIASNSNDVSTTPVSNAGDVMMASSSQNEELLNNNSILPKEDPPEGKITAIIAVIRGKPKDSHHRHSNKHYKQKLVQVLLDSGSDSDLVFVNKDKPMLLPSSKKLVPQLWNTLNGMFQTKCKAGIELNFFKYSNSKRYLVVPDISSSAIRIISHNMTSFLSQNHERVWYHLRL